MKTLAVKVSLQALEESDLMLGMLVMKKIGVSTNDLIYKLDMIVAYVNENNYRIIKNRFNKPNDETMKAWVKMMTEISTRD